MEKQQFPRRRAIKTSVVRTSLTLAAVVACHLAFPASQAQAPGPIALREGLGVTAAGRSARGPVHTDAVEAEIVAGRWKPPTAGDSVTLPDGRTLTWGRVIADKDGVFQGPAFRGGYAAFSIDSPTDRVALLDASGHSMVYVNGEPRTGDVYQTGWTLLPVALHKGANQLLFLCGRGELKASLTDPAAPALLNPRDLTLPDLVVGVPTRTIGAILVINATPQTLSGLTLHVQASGLASTDSPVPPLPPLSIRKIAFQLRGTAPTSAGTLPLALALRRGHNSRPLDTARFDLRIRTPSQTQKHTFVSRIDGSVQYYAINPASAPQMSRENANRSGQALFLSLHGAGVEAIGQADAYSPKSWGTIVAPTNRRPYGFDWENWGRIDALEVLDEATRLLKPDPRRIYLTGHSMGGHGTWHLGATFPDRFAAIGPSAGWISLFSYAGAARPEKPSAMQEMLLRPMLPSDTLALEHNYAQEGVYILHGDADDNVPVTEARKMKQELAAFHHDVTLYEQPGAGHWWDASDEPGADCVDWLPMFDLFARRSLPSDDSVRQIEFATGDPGVSARCHWASIERQAHPLKISSVNLRCDPGQRRISGTTDNVACLSLHLDPITVPGPLTVNLDGQKLENIAWPVAVEGSSRASQPELWLLKELGKWRVSAEPDTAMKRPERCGPFKRAFGDRVLLVYGTKGTPEENTWSYARARYDAEQFWYRGNGSIETMPDTSFDPRQDPDRNVVLYGNADTNGAWNHLVADTPVMVSRDGVRIGGRALEGADLACLMIRPRPGSAHASVGIVGGSSLTGMRLTDRIPYFMSGVEYPDCIVFSPETLTKGLSGIRAAGYFGPDWTMNGSEFE